MSLPAASCITVWWLKHTLVRVKAFRGINVETKAHQNVFAIQTPISALPLTKLLSAQATLYQSLPLPKPASTQASNHTFCCCSVLLYIHLLFVRLICIPEPRVCLCHRGTRGTLSCGNNPCISTSTSMSVSVSLSIYTYNYTYTFTFTVIITISISTSISISASTSI